MPVSEFEQARKHMVDSQIRPADVTDRRLIAAFLDTPRHLFVPRARRASAYADAQVATSENRTMMRPRDLAKLIHAAQIQPTELVLDIAGGRGYSTAILARMQMGFWFIRRRIPEKQPQVVDDERGGGSPTGQNQKARAVVCSPGMGNVVPPRAVLSRGNQNTAGLMK